MSFKARLLKNHLSAVEDDFYRGQGLKGLDLKEKARLPCSKSSGDNINLNSNGEPKLHDRKFEYFD